MKLNLFNTILFLVMCHMIGDYVLQTDFLAKTKGTSWYHLFVHSLLYSIPFLFVFPFNYKLYILIISHFIIDALKARYKKIDYVTDQLLHYLVLTILFIVLK